MSDIEYRVVTGDTLWSIARRYHTTVEELARINHISDVHQIHVDQSLRIPKARSAPRQANPKRFHKVGAGETLATIAQRYDISVEALAQANRLLAHQQAPLGHQLKIPGAGSDPSHASKASLPTHSPSPPGAGLDETDVEALLGSKGTPVMTLGRVSNIEGVNLRARPDTSGSLKRKLPFNTRLFVSHALPGGWYFAALEDKSVGYIDAKHINLQLPEPGALLHKIKPNEGALQIVKQYYKGNAIQWGQDERYYVNVLVEANRGTGPRGIYNPSTGADWSQAKTREDYLIWIPSLDFASRLKGQLPSGSITHELWRKARHAAELVEDVTLGSVAFVAGLIHGALESVWDFLAGLVDLVKLAWKVVSSVFTGELLDDLKSLWELVKSIDAHALLDAGLKAFLERWNAPELMKRWHFRGWLVGYAIAEIIMLFCDGVAVLKWIGKTGRLGELLEQFPMVVKALKKAEETWKTVPEATRRALAKARSMVRTERLLEYEKLVEKIRKTYALAEFEKIVARGRQLALSNKQILDFMEMGSISKPWKNKAALTFQDLLQQMEKWVKVIRPRGYPFLFENLEQFKQFQTALRKIARKYSLPEGRFAVQGSALRTALAKDVDIAIFISDEQFVAYVERCRAGIFERTGSPQALNKIIKDLDKAAEEGHLLQFQFDRLPETPRISFQSELYDALENIFREKVGVSLMTTSSEMNLYPFLDFLPEGASKAGLLSKLGTRPLPLLGVIHHAGSTSMSTKYYQGLAVEADQEVSAESARKLDQYARAFFGASGQLDKVELYSKGRILRVDYHGNRTAESVKGIHREYKGVGFTLHHALETVGRFSWERVQFYTASGELKMITAVLQDKQHHGWMEVHRDVDMQVTGIMKYFWETPTELRYVFEYDRGGRLVSVHDLVHGEGASLEEARRVLTDSNFFESGFTLPKEIMSTAIPQ